MRARTGGRLPNLTIDQKQTTRSSLSFIASLDGGRKTVLSLIPGESASGGLRYRLYINRFAAKVGLPEEAAKKLLPAVAKPWTYDPHGGPDWAGYEGVFTSSDEISRLFSPFKGDATLSTIASPEGAPNSLG